MDTKSDPPGKIRFGMVQNRERRPIPSAAGKLRRPPRKARWAVGILPLAGIVLCMTGCGGMGTVVDLSKWYVAPGGNDQNDCHSASTACKTIQKAVDKAAPYGDTVNIAAGTYVENVQVRKSLTLIGAGEVATVLDGNGDATRQQTVLLEGTSLANISVSLSALAVRHGHAGGGGATIYGGGIYAHEVNATLTDVAVTDNVAERDGGGIYVDRNSNLALNNVSVLENRALNRNGGGIYTNATLTMIGGEIRDNEASIGQGGSGGGLYTSGVTSLTNVVIDGNQAVAGGGIYQGLAPDLKTHLTILSSTISNNHVSGTGGGIDNYFTDDESHAAMLGYLMLTDSTVAHNVAGGAGGGIINEHRASAYLINDTISDNQAAAGGGIANGMVNSTVVAINVTIAYDQASQGGGILNTAFFQIQNVLIAKNNGGNCSDYGSGAAISSAADLSSDPTCQLSGPLDHDNVADPKIGTLADNGGPTQTIALLQGSPAINAGVEFLAPTTDQRGFPRNGDLLGVDIGAYEVATKTMSGQLPATVVTATPSPIIITLSRDSQCFSGPGPSGRPVTELPKGSQPNILGRSGDGSWFYVASPGRFPCWIEALDGAVSGGDPMGAPVLAAGPTETPTPTLTPTVAAPFFRVTVSSTHIYYRGTGCGDNQVQFRVQAADPAKVAGVWLFVRLRQKGGDGITPWGDALVMTPLGSGRYGYNLASEDIPDFHQFADAWVQYQFVAYDKAFGQVARSDVFSDVELSLCNH
jgi:predicted outer membrane repeat protein